MSWITGVVLAGLTVGSLALAAPASAQDRPLAKPGDTIHVTPRYERFRTVTTEPAPTTAGLPTWTYKWTYNTLPYVATMVGSAPTKPAVTIPVFIIPVAVVVNGSTFSPAAVQGNGATALANTVNSPLFTSGVHFIEAGADLGKTQYIDAFQRGNFWSKLKTNPNWHTLLGAPTVLPLHTITVPGASGVLDTAFGANVALVSIGFLDTQLQAILAANPQITPRAIPIFVTYNVYTTSGAPTEANCCIGGYHTYTGVRTYIQFSYIGTPGAFAQDVSALSHELGEWADDPLLNNQTACGLLEVGDPQESDANFGDFTYVSGGFAYNLQDMVWMRYFGAPKALSLGGRYSFQGAALTACVNGS